MACATFCTNPRFRAPKWRGVRAFLFVSIGWSGAIPMTHAVQKWGRAQVDAQMGWDILFLEGLLYITGAIIYAVTIFLCKLFCRIANIVRLAYQSAGDLVHSIFGATHINSFICLLFLGQSCISEASSLLSIMRMIRPHAVFVAYLEYQAEPQQYTIFSAARHRTKAPQDMCQEFVIILRRLRLL